MPCAVFPPLQEGDKGVTQTGGVGIGRAVDHALGVGDSGNGVAAAGCGTVSSCGVISKAAAADHKAEGQATGRLQRDYFLRFHLRQNALLVLILV